LEEVMSVFPRSKRLACAALVVTGAALLLACGDAPAAPSPRAHTPGCQAPAGVTNRPTTIEQSVGLANALPKPLTLPCYLEALARPLPLHATLSEFSAQPARGERSPRLFIYFEPLIMTVVPDGLGRHLLEFGEQRPEHHSLKGELAFPLEAQVGPGEVYERTLFDSELTGCAFCHASERPDPSVPGGRGFVSQSLRPHDRQRVALAFMKEELAACDAAAEPERCAMLDSLFGWGEIVDWEFPREMATFGN
jgi:hypothetical protein